MWHDHGMDDTEARRLLADAIARRDATIRAADEARDALHEVVRAVAPVLRQVDIARDTGWTRETIRRIVRGGGP